MLELLAHSDSRSSNTSAGCSTPHFPNLPLLPSCTWAGFWLEAPALPTADLSLGSSLSGSPGSGLLGKLEQVMPWSFPPCWGRCFPGGGKVLSLQQGPKICDQTLHQRHPCSSGATGASRELLNRKLLQTSPPCCHSCQ